MTTGVYIDGLNLYYGALRNSDYKWLDLEKLAHLLVPQDQIGIIRYFTARVNARPNDLQLPVRQDAYLRALSTCSLVSIHKGRFVSAVKSKALADRKIGHQDLFTPHFRPQAIYKLMWGDQVRRRTDGTTKAKVLIDEEKGSDVNLGVHLVNDAARGLLTKALVISNDSDLTEAITLSRNFGILVGIVNPHRTPTSRHLRKAANFEIRLRHETLSRCQLLPTVFDSRGREIHKPHDWAQTQRPVLSDGPRAHLPKQVGG